MPFTINDDKYKSSFFKQNRFQHNKGNLIKLFPFATDTTSLTDSAEEFRSFRGITGNFFRAAKKITFKENVSKEVLLKSVIDAVETPNKFDFKNLINELFFDDADNLVLFDTDVLPHLNLRTTNSKLENQQIFISNLLIDEEIEHMVNSALSKHKNSNILYMLVLEQLDKITVRESISIDKTGTYDGRITQEIRQLFKRDLKELLRFEEFFIEHISILIKYYYFQYITRLTIQLNLMFKEQQKCAPLFFSLDWEKLSRSRFCLENGWNKLEISMEQTFAHANCLELLNTIQGSEGCFAKSTPFTYEEILETVKNLSEDAEKDLSIKIHRLITQYKDDIKYVERNHIDFNWDNLTFPENLEGENESKYHSLNLIKKLFQYVKYQFENTGRKKPYLEYKVWFTNFVKVNYIKFRGTLGSTLKIDRPLLLMFTELSILSSKNDKIILTKLWSDFEQRGIFLDHESKKEIIIFFEKINMLEKKSDSGDAQYVRSLLTK